MSIHATLRGQLETLQKLYDSNEEGVRSLQSILSNDILPGLTDELGLSQVQREALENWLLDTPSVFRILKRHKFTTSFALEALRNTLTWRASFLPSLDAVPPTPFLRCLPLTAHDPFGRPIVLMRLAELSGGSEDLKTIIIRNMELFRLHLHHLNAQRCEDLKFRPILQYVALLDIKCVSFNSMQNVDLLGWYINELLPRFPGMLAAVFVLNYTWAHNGLWNLMKRTLPTSALAKVFFPSQSELLEYFSPGMIPQDYGGDMPALSVQDDPLNSYLPNTSTSSERDAVRSGLLPMPSSSCPLSPTTDDASARLSAMSRTSLVNPFFGYPVTYTDPSSSTPSLRYGRRRKRDLARTLLQLWWMKWKVQTTATLIVIALLLVVFTRKRSWLHRWRWRLGSLPALRSVVETLALL